LISPARNVTAPDCIGLLLICRRIDHVRTLQTIVIGVSIIQYYDNHTKRSN